MGATKVGCVKIVFNSGRVVKVGCIKIVFNNGRVVTYSNVMVVIKEDCIVVEKNKNSIEIIPCNNVTDIYLCENEWKEKREDGRNENFWKRRILKT